MNVIFALENVPPSATDYRTKVGRHYAVGQDPGCVISIHSNNSKSLTRPAGCFSSPTPAILSGAIARLEYQTTRPSDRMRGVWGVKCCQFCRRSPRLLRGIDQALSSSEQQASEPRDIHRFLPAMTNLLTVVASTALRNCHKRRSYSETVVKNNLFWKYKNGLRRRFCEPIKQQILR